MSDFNTVASRTASRSKGYYIIEWRIKENIPPMILDNPGPTGLGKVLTDKWEPFLVDFNTQNLDGPSAGWIIRPMVSPIDDEAACKAGLMTKLVAEAIVACTKTRLECGVYGVLDAVEFRLVECSWESSFTATKRLVEKAS